MAIPEITRPDETAEGPTIEVTDARGARRVGLIWMLVVSTALAALVLLGIWAFDSHHLSKVSASDNPGLAAAAPEKAPSRSPSPVVKPQAAR